MAPRKKRNAETEDAAPKPAAANLGVRRVTRSMNRPAAEESLAPVKKQKAEKAETKKPKKAVATAGLKGKKDDSFSEEDEKVGAGSSSGGLNKVENGIEVSSDNHFKSGKGGSVAAPCTVVIEHCKQCNAFKTRALQVKEALEKGVPGVTVLLNPDKPRRGCFEIREKDGNIFISLLDMKRPFKPMKDLNMEEVIADIIGKVTT